MSRPRFVLTPQARADLVEIWNYIAEDSPENADRVLERLYAGFTGLAETPGMGHHREDLADPAPPLLDGLLLRDRLPRSDQPAADHCRRSRSSPVGGVFPAPHRRAGFRGSRMSRALSPCPAARMDSVRCGIWCSMRFEPPDAHHICPSARKLFSGQDQPPFTRATVQPWRAALGSRDWRRTA